MLKKLLLLTLIWTGTMPAITEDKVKGFSLGTFSAFLGAAALRSNSNQDAACMVGLGAVTALGVRWYLNKMTPTERIKQAEVMVGIAEEVYAKQGNAVPVKKTLIQNDFRIQKALAGRTVRMSSYYLSRQLAWNICFGAQDLINKAREDGGRVNNGLEKRISTCERGALAGLTSGEARSGFDKEIEYKVSGVMSEEVKSRTFWGFKPCFYKWQ